MGTGCRPVLMAASQRSARLRSAVGGRGRPKPKESALADRVTGAGRRRDYRAAMTSAEVIGTENIGKS